MVTMATIVSIWNVHWCIDGGMYSAHSAYCIRQRGYPTINWWRHTTNILLDIAIHTEMWLCWVWGYARLMGGKNALMIGFLVTWRLAREREDSISTRQSTTMERHNNILLIGYCNSCGNVGAEYIYMRWSMGRKDITIRVCYCCQVYNVWGKCQMAGQDGGTITTKTGMLAKRTLLQ